MQQNCSLPAIYKNEIDKTGKIIDVKIKKLKLKAKLQDCSRHP